MPQFDPSTFGSQLFWLALCFFTLNVVMLKWLLPRLRRTIETRKNAIKMNQQKTKILLDMITAVGQDADRQLHMAHIQAREYIRRELQEIEKKHKEVLKGHEAALQEKTIHYRAEFDVQIEKARHDLKEAAIEFADDLTKKFFPYFPKAKQLPEKKPHQ